MSGRAESNCPIEWGSRESCNFIRCHARSQCKEFRFPGLRFAIYRQPDNALRHSFLAAILLASKVGRLPVHRA